MREISSIGEEILASQEELCSKELVGFSLPIYSLTYFTHSLTHSLILSTNQVFMQINLLVLPNLTTKLKSVCNIKIQPAVFMLLHVNTKRWTDKAIY
jgi:hypothetical protein